MQELATQIQPKERQKVIIMSSASAIILTSFKQTFLSQKTAKFQHKLMITRKSCGI